MEKTALVLSGGGSRGAYEIGVWRALRELDERFSMVTGTSVGALNGAVIAQGSLPEAERLWQELETSRVFDVQLDETLPKERKLFEAIFTFGRAAALEGGAGAQRLREILGQYIDEDAVRASAIQFGLMTIQMQPTKPTPMWMDEIPSGKLVDYLLASSALFPAIRPAEIDGKKYIDGGYCDNMPMRMAVARGATRLIAVNMEAIGVIRRDGLEEVQELREIRCYWDLGAILLFDPHSARLNLRLGYLDTMRAYGVFDGFAYAFVKGSLQTVVRHDYERFYAVAELLGFHSVRKRFLDSVAYSALQKRVFRRGIAAPALRGFALDGMEMAAELFGLSVETVYTLERFTERLSEAVQAVALPEMLEGLDFWQAPAQAALTAALELASRAAKCKYLYRIIRGCMLRDKPFPLLPVAALMPDEFSAALFLALHEH